MRIALVVLAVLWSGLSDGAKLPLFFNSGSNFSGSISRHKAIGDSDLEARFSRVGEKITLRMLTMGDKAIILAAQYVGTDKAFVDTFQSDNTDAIFTAGKTALEEKTRQSDRASQNSFFRTEVYRMRDYQNKDLIVASRLLTDADGTIRERVPGVTVVLHPLDNDTIQGEFLVSDPDGTILENLWFDAKREGIQKDVQKEDLPPPQPKP